MGAGRKTAREKTFRSSKKKRSVPIQLIYRNEI
jgi:hypothetical protein